MMARACAATHRLPVNADTLNRDELTSRKLCRHTPSSETALYSDNLKIAGRVDCIAEFDGVPAIIDFKNSKKPKKEEWIEDYFLQATFYSYAFYERTGTLIENIRILVCVRDGQIQVFEKNVKDYIKKLDNRVKEYYNQS